MGFSLGSSTVGRCPCRKMLGFGLPTLTFTLFSVLCIQKSKIFQQRNTAECGQRRQQRPNVWLFSERTEGAFAKDIDALQKGFQLS
jgi:hypothetical protein